MQCGVPVVLTLLAVWKTQIINFQETSNQHLNYPSVGKAHRSSKNTLDKWGKKWNLVDNWHRRRIGYYEISPSWKLWPWYDMYNILCIIYHVYILISRLQLFFNFGSRWALSELKCILGHFWPFSGEFLENSKMRFSQKAPKHWFDLKLFLTLVLFARILFDDTECFFLPVAQAWCGKYSGLFSSSWL